MRVYLDVPYSDKDLAKRRGAKWDAQRKRWYVMSTPDLSSVWKWVSLNQPKKANQPLAREGKATALAHC
jgi:hypothetical protein